MNKLTNCFLLLIFSTLLITSCTIQKRTVNKGYFVQWHWNQKVKTSSENQENFKQENFQTRTEQIKVSEEQKALPILVSEESEVIETNPVETGKNESSGKNDGIETPKINPEKSQEIYHKAVQTENKKQQLSSPVAVEQIINIFLLVGFLIFTIVFAILALSAAGNWIFIYWGLSLLCFILFITQIFDVALY